MEEVTRLLVSHPSRDGSVIVCAVPAGTRVLAQFTDEAEPRDITRMLPDLLLLGLQAPSVCDDGGGRSDLLLVGQVHCVGAEPELLFASPPGQVVHPFAFTDARAHIEAGIAAQITAGVRYESSQGEGGVAEGEHGA